MNLLDRLRGQRALTLPYPVDQWNAAFNGIGYSGLTGMTSMSGSKRQEIDNTFVAYVRGIHEREGVVSAAVAARSLLLSQLRFKFRSLSDGPQGQLYGTEALLPLERFAPPLTRPRLLMRAEQHASYSGVAYFYRPLGGTVRLINPDHISLIVASNMDGEVPAHQLDGELVGYWHTPNPDRKHEGRLLAPSEVVQWAPEPHPLNPWIGQSWVTSILSEITGDQQAVEYQSRFYENAATPNMIFSFPKEIAAAVIQQYAEMVNAGHTGAANAGKNLFMGHGADAKVVGATLGDLDLRNAQGGVETRIALRSRVPAVILGIREGMQGSALNSGNYNSARRMWSDGWFSPTGDGLSDCLAGLVDVPGGSELTYDRSQVLFLQEDRKDEAEIQQFQATTISTLITAGYDPTTVSEAVRTGDFSKLKHTGRVSVQLQEMGADPTPPQEAA